MPHFSKSDIRIQVIGLFVLALLSVLIARLWWVQVSRGQAYTNMIRSSSQVTVRIPSVRGEIRDRNGIPLVTNRPSFEVDFYLPSIVNGYRKLMGDVPQSKYSTTRGGFKKEVDETDIVKVVQDGIIQRLDDLGLAKDFNAEGMRNHFRQQTYVPYTYMDDLDFPTMAKFAEHNVGLPGVELTVQPVRHYVYGALAAHLLGYVGMPKQIDELPDIHKFNFYQPDLDGKTNIEKFMDSYLRGSPGARILKKNSKGVIEGEIGIQPSKPGSNVYLTIDARIQFIAEQALRAVGRGAAVVVNPNNGDILAMASVPSYDPNIFIPRITEKEWKILTDDETDPLLNRALSAYAPGSTYKLAIALAGLKKGIDPNYRGFVCSGGVTYGNKFMKCWIADKHGAHGALNLSEALKNSCNAYFYQYGNAAGIDNIDAVGAMLGLGAPSGIELSNENPGVLPGKEWLKVNLPRERWTEGYTANTSIGQGFVLASPLQMAMVGATVANGGICYYPRIIHKVVDSENQTVMQDAPKIRANLVEEGISPEKIEYVRKGMWMVVNEAGGTARAAQIKGTTVAGKTGTAQNWRESDGRRVKDNHTWFVAFAPYKDPQLAICVMIEGAKSGGGTAAPLARKILEESLAIQRGYNPPLQALAPAPGNFRFVESINFDSSVPAQFAADDGETTESVAGPEPNSAPASTSRVARTTAAPDIKPEADDAGKVKKTEKKQSFFQKLFGGGKSADEPSTQRAKRPPRFRD